MIKLCDQCYIDHSIATYKQGLELKHPFPGSKNIKNNYSQMYQDMFVLSMLNGKRKGVYLEIGSGHPVYGNNTYLLEKYFDWTGQSIDKANYLFDSELYEPRKNPTMIIDALKADYIEILSNDFKKNVDYLQIDCDPPSQSYEILTKIPFDSYRFAVITFEHDYFCDPEKKYRELSREYLKSKGYVLVAGNMGINSMFPFEDWWVHPELISITTINKFKNNININNAVEEYMLKNFKFNRSFLCAHDRMV